jgi:toxin CcdB
MTKSVAFTRKPVGHLTPEVSFNGDRYVLITPQLAGVGRTELGTQAGTLVDERQVILAAIDFLLTGF